MAVKLTVVYDNPSDPEAFERHYRDVHMPLARKIPDAQRIETAKVFPKEDGSATPAYRTADVYFADYDTACAALASPDGRAAAQDAAQLGEAGVRFLLSDIDND